MELKLKLGKQNAVQKFVKYGYKIPEVAEEVQKAILEAVSSLSGLKVVEVNVYVQNVKMEDIEETTEEFED